MIHLVLATRNTHKAAEIQSILGPPHSYTTLADLPAAPAVVEDAPTFAGNATRKAVALARWYSAAQFPEPPNITRTYILADDSGLEADALDGAPGVYSARFAALETPAIANPQIPGPGNSPDAANNARLLRLLRDVPIPQRTARFHCVVALTPTLPIHAQNASPACTADAFELQTELFDGVCEGTLLFEPRGPGGFGYDPLFVPNGYALSFAELGEETKNRLSHRARALKKLKARLSSGNR